MASTSLQRIRGAIIILVTIFIIGVIGYVYIEDIPLLDALYMTVITISTVGFGEVDELSDGGRLFTILLIITSFGFYAYAISMITTYFVELKVSKILKRPRFKTERKMKNHIVICGFGRNGQQAAKELTAHNQPFVVIDNNHDLVEGNLEKPFRFIEGDSTQDDILLKADIENAKSLITTLPNDANNLYVVITARALNHNLTIISRASDESSQKKLRMAGVDNVVMPEKVGGAHMAQLIARPDVIEFLEHLSVRGDDPTNLEEILCNNLPEDFINKPITKFKIREHTGANIVGFKTPSGDIIVNPLPDTRIVPGSKLFVLGTPEQIKNMKEVIGA